ncbi:30S ribosomal protein S7 [Patescibacteria group bacterium]|nr:30S ribosomal protein S7 [Patescibacteria group bacterium]
MRGSHKANRPLLDPDPKFGSITVAKLINYLMKNGKKEVARKIAYAAIEQAAEKLSADPLDVVETAIKNISPVIEVRGRRVGGANLQVPIEVSRTRRLMLAMRWLLAAARSAKGRPMAEKLAKELVDAYNNEGTAVKKKEETHRMAEANRAFAHFARY